MKWLIPDERVFFNDDFNSGGEILCDTSGRKFQERLSRVFPFRFKGLTQKEIEKLSFIIWPEAKIDLPPRKGLGKIRFQREVLALDESQARLARNLGDQHAHGPPRLRGPRP